MSKNKSTFQAHDITTAVLVGVFFYMLTACVLVSVYDVYGWIMLGDFQAAGVSALLGCLFLRVFFAMPELERQMLDPKVSKLQFFKYCLKLVLPFVFKSFKE